MVASSFARLPFLAGLAVPVRVQRPQREPARDWPRMNLPRESPLPEQPAVRGRDLRIRSLAAELLSRA